MATALPAGSKMKKLSEFAYLLPPMRFQVPYSGEMGGGGVRSIVPVAIVTPPAVKDCMAVKVTSWVTRWTWKIHVPSMGAPSPDPPWALTGWLRLPVARVATASTSAPALLFISFVFIVSSQFLKSPPALGTVDSAGIEETRPWTAHEPQPNCV